MRNPQNLTIVLLCVTAIVLGSLLIGTWNEPKAYGEASVKQGDYVLLSGQLTESTDLVYLVNIASREMNVYFPDGNADRGNGELRLVDQINLDQAFR